MDKNACEELSNAIENGDLTRLEELIASGIDTEVILERYGKPAFVPLTLAAEYSNLKAVNILLTAGADPNGVCAKGEYTALMHSASNGKKRDVEVARQLIAAGADVNYVVPSAAGQPAATALSRAAVFACPEMIDFLIDHGADVDFRLFRGTALMRAAGENTLKNVKVLIARGADPRICMPDNHPFLAGLNALEIAREKKAKKVVAYLEQVMGGSQAVDNVKKDSKAAPKAARAPAVEDTWRRIRATLRSQREDVLQSLGRAATEKQIEAAETKLGMEFPKDFRTSLRVLNGQREPVPFVSGDNGDEFGYSLLPLKEIVAEWKCWKELFDDGEFVDNDANGDEGVRDAWWNVKWIPITSDGGGNHHCLDMSPAKGGKRGQVIHVRHDDGYRARVSVSFASWLAEWADELHTTSDQSPDS